MVMNLFRVTVILLTVWFCVSLGSKKAQGPGPRLEEFEVRHEETGIFRHTGACVVGATLNGSPIYTGADVFTGETDGVAQRVPSGQFIHATIADVTTRSGIVRVIMAARSGAKPISIGRPKSA